MEKQNTTLPVLRKILQILKYVLLSLVLLLFLLISTINLPFVHQLLTNKANSIFHDKGWPVHIGNVSILLSGEIGLTRLEIIPKAGDTVLYAGKLNISISPGDLFHKRIVVQNIQLQDVAVNLLTDTATGELALFSLFPTSKKSPALPKEKKTPSSWVFSIREVHLQNIRFFYDDPVHGIIIKQAVYKADILADTFSPTRNKIDLASAKLEKINGYVAISAGIKEKDTIQTVSAPSPWKISARNIQLSDVLFMLDEPGSKQQVKVSLVQGNFSLKTVDLAAKNIIVTQLELHDPAVEILTSGNTPQAKSTQKKENFSFAGFPWSVSCALFDIKNGSFSTISPNKTQSDPLQKWMPVKAFNTTISNVKMSSHGSGFTIGNLSFDMNGQAMVNSGKVLFEMDSMQKGKLSVELSAMLNHEKNTWFARNDELRLTADLKGSLNKLDIGKFELHIPSGVELSAAGSIMQPLNVPEADCKLIFHTNVVTRLQVTELVSIFSTGLKLPEFMPISLSGTIENSFLTPVFNLDLQSQSGNINLAGDVDLNQKTGETEAIFHQVKLGELIGNADLGTITGQANLQGSWKNVINLAAGGTIQIDSFDYKNVTAHDITAEFSVANNECVFDINARDTALACAMNGLFSWNGSSYQGQLKGNFMVDAGQLHLVPGRLSTQGDITANFRKTADSLNSKLSLKNIEVNNGIKTSRLHGITAELNLGDSLIDAKLKTDFLTAGFISQASIGNLLEAIKTTRFQNILSLDSTRSFNLQAISEIPVFNLTATASYDSLLSLFLPDTVFNYQRLDLAMGKKSKDSMATASVSADGLLYKQFKTYGLKASVGFDHDKLGCRANLDSLDVGKVLLGKSSFTLDLLPGSMLGNLLVSDRKGIPLYELGARLLKHNDLVILQSTMPQWILNSNTWTLSPAEFMRWQPSSGELFADLHLQHDSMRIDLSGRKSERLNLDIQNVQISMLVSPEILSYLPDGKLNASVTYSDRNRKSLDFKMDVAQLKWQDLLLDRISAHGKLIADTTGILQSGLFIQLNDSATVKLDFGNFGESNSKALQTTFTSIPVALFEPFMNKYADRLQGSASGYITLGKENNKSRMDGEIRVKDVALSVVPLKARFLVPEDTLVIKQNQLFFNHFVVLDSMQKRSVVDGTLNFDDPKNITANIHAALDKLQVMNTTVKDNPVFFGSIVVNSGIDISGPIISPAIKGNISLESGTNLTYRQIQDLSVKETQKAITFARLDGNRLLVVDNTKAITRLTQMPSIQTTVEINPKSIFNVEISGMYNIGVHFSGGGLLEYTMLPNNTTSLTGSYEIQNGSAELKITGWPKKKFVITPGSTLQWNGNIDDPALTLEATSKVKGSYLNPVDNKNRNVDFIVSMKLSNQLSQLNIAFDVSSPDQYITTVMNSLSADEVMKQAVNLLLFGSIQLPGIESSSNYLAAQMDSFWESQLNAMTKTSIKNVDLSFGIDTYTQTSSTGSQDKTSFTYEMERKLWKDRASVKVSGRLNDDNSPGQTSSNVIENFTFEYALDTIGNKFLKLYRHQDYEDILEGEVIKSGVGFIYRKNFPYLKDIWKRTPKQSADKPKTIPDTK